MNNTIETEYRGEMRCEILHPESGAKIGTDVPQALGGRGSLFSPTDLIASGLASCILSTIAIVAERRGIDLRGTRVRVQKEMVSRPVQRIGALRTWIELPKDLEITPSELSRLMRAANNCPVHRSLHPDIDAPISWSGAESTEGRCP